MTTRLGTTFALTLLAGGLLQPAHAVTIIPITKSSLGTQTNCGGEDQTEAFIRALSAARLQKSKAPSETIVIELPAGSIFLSRKVILGSDDSGSPGAPLIIRGLGTGKTVLTGAVPLSGSVPLENPIPGHGSVFSADLSQCPTTVPLSLVKRGAYAGTPTSGFELFQGERRLTPARWPKTGYFDVGTLVAQSTGDSGPRIKVPPEESHRWSKEHDMQLAGFWAADWAYETLRVTSIDAAQQTLTLEVATAKPVREHFRFFALNARADLDELGNYALDLGHKSVAYIPYIDKAPVERVRTDTLFELNHAHDIVFENLSLEKTLGTAIVIRNSSDVLLRNCFVGHTGARAIEVTGGRNVHVQQCVVWDTAETGVSLTGGDRDTLNPAHHSIEDSVIDTFGVESKSYRPGVELHGVGLKVSGNYIAFGPHAGLILAGNDHTISGNEMTDLLRETDDAGAIYMGRDWTERGNTFIGNYFHDIGDTTAANTFLAGIYLDDEASGALIKRNAFVHVSRPIVIGGGRDTIVEGNGFFQSGPGAVYLDDRGKSWQHDMVVSGELRKRLNAVPITSPAWLARYPFLPALTSDRSGDPVGNCVRNNVVVGSPELTLKGGLTAEIARQGCDQAASASHDAIGAFPEVRAIADVARLDRQHLLNDLPYAYKLRN